MDMREQMRVGLAVLAIGGALASPASAAQPDPALSGALNGAALERGPDLLRDLDLDRALAEQSSVEQQGEANPAEAPTEVTAQMIDWVTASRDNGRLPFIVIDKVAAAMFVFTADGQPAGAAPTLLGIASGDDSTPGIGERDLAEIGPAERTTPAGRFVAHFGRAYGGATVLWVDFATSVAIHPVVTGNPRERRMQRLTSLTPEDNRITFGCINVPPDFYRDVLQPLFGESGGIVYILPETRPFEEVFPRMLVAAGAPPAPAPAPDKPQPIHTTSFSLGR